MIGKETGNGEGSTPKAHNRKTALFEGLQQGVDWAAPRAGQDWEAKGLGWQGSHFQCGFPKCASHCVNRSSVVQGGKGEKLCRTFSIMRSMTCE